MVKQPSLLSTGNFVVPETLTASPDVKNNPGSFRCAIQEEVESEDLITDVETFHIQNDFLSNMATHKQPEPVQVAKLEGSFLSTQIRRESLEQRDLISSTIDNSH